MTTKRREVGQLNNIVCEYLEGLGVSEPAKLEFLSRANSMIALDCHRSVWFDRITARLSQILHQIQLPRPQIDLNEPPAAPPQHNKVEDEAGRSHVHRKRKRVTSTALRIRENKPDLTSGMPEPSNVVRPSDKHNNQVTLILVSDFD